jgi:sirohydrochlorin ferrochelatase
VAPFGADPDLPGLMARVAVEAAGAAGLVPGRSALLLAAHGSQVSRRSADTTHGMARMLAARTPFARVTAGFVEEAPRLVDAARGLGPGVCLPFFALRAGHVEEDVPQALAEAGFDGPLLPPIGEHAGVPGLIARALLRAG